MCIYGHVSGTQDLMLGLSSRGNGNKVVVVSQERKGGAACRRVCEVKIEDFQVSFLYGFCERAIFFLYVFRGGRPFLFVGEDFEIFSKEVACSDSRNEMFEFISFFLQSALVLLLLILCSFVHHTAFLGLFFLHGYWTAALVLIDEAVVSMGLIAMRNFVRFHGRFLATFASFPFAGDLVAGFFCPECGHFGICGSLCLCDSHSGEILLHLPSYCFRN
ncbi:hypothetical protein CEXT_4781 [Caerostris extrusa]|uniref:Uncharacterized protein n=1 Tax=Caerostris extrusa TaxID=172846 RepID=A0AAV4N3K9_CAEEX|nr:hypothetical protein CEXT_4781 [Caerostris extrusa]